jgi:hypothetical protein
MSFFRLNYKLCYRFLMRRVIIKLQTSKSHFNLLVQFQLDEALVLAQICYRLDIVSLQAYSLQQRASWR